MKRTSYALGFSCKFYARVVLLCLLPHDTSDQSERTSNIFIAGITTANYMSTSCYASSINCHNSIHNYYHYGSLAVASTKRSDGSKGT